MSVPGFSKVGAIYDDEEDEEKIIISKAIQQYKAAQAAYFAKDPWEDILALFAAAEATMAPLLSNGIMCLERKQLEMVLEGRLHQAVIIAGQGASVPDRWSKAKSLSEDVLNFDHNNFHALWIRGKAILYGQRRVEEARRELLRAIECARASGNNEMADQWVSEVEELSDDHKTDLDQSRADVLDQIPYAEPEDEECLPVASPPDSGSAKPALKKGFLNRRSQKVQRVAMDNPPPLHGSAASSSKPPATADVTPATAAKEVDAAQRAKALALDKELQEKHAQQEQELGALTEALRAERERRSHRSRDVAKWQEQLHDGLENARTEFVAALASERLQRRSEAEADSEVLKDAISLLKTRVEEALADFRSGKEWSQSQHQKYTDLATELATLREMSVREMRERQGTSQKQVSDMRDLTVRLAEFKADTKVLRDHVRRMTLESEDSVDCDASQEDIAARRALRVAKDAKGFHDLPSSIKVWALLDDATVTLLVALLVLLGMLFMIGMLTQGFGNRSCRFVCAR